MALCPVSRLHVREPPGCAASTLRFALVILITGGGSHLLEIHPHRLDTARRFCVGGVPSLDEVLSTLEPISANYVLFLACDATSLSDESLQNSAKRILDRGMVYLCAWGPDCERLHDQFDVERVQNEPSGRVVMTTWHSKESLSEALWFFANCAEPAEGFKALCTDWVAISVAND
jgi:hypothetical protein